MSSEHDERGVRAAVFRSGVDAALALFMSTESSGQWEDSEYADILRHQLAAPILVDLSLFDSSERRELEQLAGKTSGELLSFGQLLESPTPIVDLLVLTKDFAKLSDRPHARLLPPAVANVLYYAAIAAARARLSVNITSLDDPQIAKGVRWALALPWLVPSLRQLFMEAEHTLAKTQSH